MTRFLLSHNLQISSDILPIVSSEYIATALTSTLPDDIAVSTVQHGHWIIQVDSALEPVELARLILSSWRLMRSNDLESSEYQLLALGGRKDSLATSGALLQLGDWGVDLVETAEIDSFLASINWPALKSGRPTDSIFEIMG